MGSLFPLKLINLYQKSEISISRNAKKLIKGHFERIISYGSQNLLVIYGECGIGKTAALKVISRENGLKIIEGEKLEGYISF